MLSSIISGSTLYLLISLRTAMGPIFLFLTLSLIKAFELSGSTDDLSNIKSGLDKWKEIRDFC